jgi:hypothetical protein
MNFTRSPGLNATLMRQAGQDGKHDTRRDRRRGPKIRRQKRKTMTIATTSPVRGPLAARNSTTVRVGEQMALCQAIVQSGSTTARELAEAVNVSEEFAASWLWTQRIIGFLDYDRDSGRYSLWSEWPRRR